jgi:hypothetical protein
VADAEKCQSHRRYCFLKYHLARNTYGDDHADVWNTKRRSLPGTALPSNFPAREALTAAAYEVVEEVVGADATELTNAGLTASQAAAVLAELAALE